MRLIFQSLIEGLRSGNGSNFTRIWGATTELFD